MTSNPHHHDIFIPDSWSLSSSLVATMIRLHASQTVSIAYERLDEVTSHSRGKHVRVLAPCRILPILAIALAPQRNAQGVKRRVEEFVIDDAKRAKKEHLADIDTVMFDAPGIEAQRRVRKATGTRWRGASKKIVF